MKKHQAYAKLIKIINGFDEPYIFHEMALKASELKSLTLDYDEKTQKFYIIVFLKDYHLYYDTKTLEQAIFIIMQDILGENSLF